eukprot:CAMPEP_0201697756 /NCGR_PEP_ID=MMETSP0578-20130828/13322_1 /ASSEMBLY_ACC=CAM_ASM_000663 /TAXON_ID=267565 /ORGANISM="Skeletonema grethea, Strain CCMP 1804" /LENGTH=40 /DNA_ID= /DNA_START= /DNA_END= /DNA_ORIENTATION=
MRTALRIRSATIGRPPFAILMGDKVSGARGHEMPMPVDGG